MGGIDMKTKFNFDSQICTTREQSIRLLALGLRKETADMFIGIDWGKELAYDKNGGYISNLDASIPAWSLARLLEMLPNPIPISEDLPTFHHYAYLDLSRVAVRYYWEDYDGDKRSLVSFYGKGFFTAVVDAIEWLIKEGRFNKEYLV